MEKYLVMAGLLVGSALVFPKVVEMQFDRQTTSAHEPQQVVATNKIATKPRPAANPLDGRKERIRMDDRGHFIANARMNGYKTDVLVDTGATFVAINESTARKLGIRLRESDFKYKVRTANGITLAAAAVIDEISIGRVRVRDVQASVSRDESLSTVLLGMAFLKKLRKFEISSNELILTQ